MSQVREQASVGSAPHGALTIYAFLRSHRLRQLEEFSRLAHLLLQVDALYRSENPHVGILESDVSLLPLAVGEHVDERGEQLHLQDCQGGQLAAHRTRKASLIVTDRDGTAAGGQDVYLKTFTSGSRDRRAQLFGHCKGLKQLMTKTPSQFAQ